MKGATPAFPCSNEHDSHDGMTYRQWLIGQALMGACASMNGDEAWPAEGMAKYCIQRADAVIDLLDEETKPERSLNQLESP